MTMKATIEEKLVAFFSPDFLEVQDESHNHNVPAGAESHFKVIMVTKSFIGLAAVKRHQDVYGVLKQELAGSVHALALHLYSPDEWSVQGGTAPDSPECLGGSKSAEN